MQKRKKLTRIRISFFRIIHDKQHTHHKHHINIILALQVFLNKTSHSGSCSGRIADRRPHGYATRLNQQRSMDQVQTELAEMRVNMASL